MKKCILTLFSISLFSISYGQTLSIDDFKIKENKTLPVRERLFDRREFMLSPQKDKILILGHRPRHTTPFSIPIEIAVIKNGKKIRKKIFEILYASSDAVVVKWETNKEILIEYSSDVKELIIYKLEMVTINREIVKIKYQAK